MNWIEEVRHDLANRERSEMLQLHREAVAKVKRPAMWRELLNCVRSKVNIHQGLYGKRPEIKATVDAGDQGFAVRKSDYPRVMVRCQFLDTRIIELHFSYQLTENADKVEWEDRIDFRVDSLDRVQFEHKGELIDTEEACDIVLRPILIPSFRPPQ